MFLKNKILYNDYAFLKFRKVLLAQGIDRPKLKPLHSWMDLGGAEAKIQLFLEYGHVAYQIKGNEACSNMVANILPAWGGVRIQLYQNMVMLQIKLNGIMNAAISLSTYSVLTHTFDPLGGFKGQNFFFSESSHVAYQIRREWSIEHHASTYSVLTHTLNVWVEFKGKKNSECGHVAYQIKGKEVKTKT